MFPSIAAPIKAMRKGNEQTSATIIRILKTRQNVNIPVPRFQIY
jgi:hypothetical protein